MKLCSPDDLRGYGRVAFVLQGGGALGAYQAGAYSALAEANIHPDWVAGISIGAINSAIIAGNEPKVRVEKLREFWEKITTPMELVTDTKADPIRVWFNQISAMSSMMFGQLGFFSPRWPNPWLLPKGSAGATSYYDTSSLRKTLEQLVDFDRINHRRTRLSVGAVNVRTGNLVYFDNREREIKPEHIMASGALPPGFPAVEIDGQHYWDGGLVSNTPLAHVLYEHPRVDTIVFQVDLFPAKGELPGEMADVGERQKDIIYSSRTRANTDFFRRVQMAKASGRYLLSKLTEEARKDPFVQSIAADASDDAVYNIIHLIYADKTFEAESKDYEFSRQSMKDHWKAGYNDTIRTLRHPEWMALPPRHIGIAVHDVHREARD